MATLSEALTAALEHHRAGRTDAAEHIYRQILAVEPDEPNTLNLLGVIATTRAGTTWPCNTCGRPSPRTTARPSFTTTWATC